MSDCESCKSLMKLIEDKTKLRDCLLPEVDKKYNENFKYNGVWGHYIIHPRLLDDKAFADFVLKESHANGWFSARAHYIRWVRREIKKNKTKEDWEKWARDFIHGFNSKGQAKMQKVKKNAKP